MSVQTPPEPPRAQVPPQAPRNPKAEAKAAKAYAKAMRPWYKKKRFILPLGLVLLMVAASAGSSGGGSGSSDNESSDTGSSGSASSDTGSSGSASSGSDEAKSKAKSKEKSNGKSGTVGQALTNAGTTYKVTGARATKTIGDPDMFGARADGMFVVVTLQLTNNKDETKTFSDTSAKIKTSDGNEYETSSDAVFAFGDDSLLLKDIQPDLTTRGKVAFELPPNKVSGSTLVIEDIFGSGEIKVDLGL